MKTPSPQIQNCPECASLPEHQVWYLPDGSTCCPHLFFSKCWTIKSKCKKVRSFGTVKLSNLHYAVTLTTSTQGAAVTAVKSLRRYVKSKQFSPTIAWSACLEHPDTNAHIHLWSHTKNYVPAKDVLKLNKSRVEVKRLKNQNSVLKWKQYIVKRVQDDPHKVVFNNLDDIDKYLSDSIEPKIICLDSPKVLSKKI